MKRRGFLTVFAILLVAGGLWFTPPEATSGDRIRLIYAHAAAIWVALIFFGLTGFMALLGLRKRRLLAVALAHDVVATGFWLSSFLLSLVSMQVVWGGIFISEPRSLMMIKVLLLSVLLYPLLILVGRGVVTSLLLLGKSGLVFFWQISTQLVMHPDRPLLRGEMTMQAPFAVVLLGLLVLAALMAISLFKRLRAEGSQYVSM